MALGFIDRQVFRRGRRRKGGVSVGLQPSEAQRSAWDGEHAVRSVSIRSMVISVDCFRIQLASRQNTFIGSPISLFESKSIPRLQPRLARLSRILILLRERKHCCITQPGTLPLLAVGRIV